MNSKDLFRTVKYDYIFGGIVLVLSISIIIFLQFAENSKEKKALIYKNGQLIREESLPKNEVINLGNLEIEMNGNQIRILKSECPQKICKHAGWISNPGQTIVCVPNKLLIEIVGKSEERKYDAVSY